jgi:hypothetical protein
VVVLAAMVANDLEALRSVGTSSSSRLFRATLCTSLRMHHIVPVKIVLFLFSEPKNVLALNAGNLNIRHGNLSSWRKVYHK